MFVFFQETHQYSMNLNKKYQENAVNLKVEDDNLPNHYSEIDKASPRGSPWSTWPEDLRNTCTAQTYVNVSDREPTSFATPIPPPPPSVGPNTSPSKSKSNYGLTQSMNDLSLNSNTSTSVTKKLDPDFLVELEKHLGEKEATKNTNTSGKDGQELGATCSNFLRLSSDKLRQSSTSAQRLSLAEDTTKSLSVIPALKPPPPGKPKSPVATMDHRASSSSTLPSKVQNSWQPKSTNVQKPCLQGDQNVTESITDAIVTQIWQQTNTLSQQQTLCPTDLPNRQVLTPISIAQGSINRIQEVTSNISGSNMNDHGQHGDHGPSNVAKAISIQAQGSLANENYSQNTTHINQSSINLLQEATSSIPGSIMNEAQHSLHNIAKTTTSIGQAAFNPLQIAVDNISVPTDSQYNAANNPKVNLNQTQVCSSMGGQNCLRNASSVGFNLLQPSINHTSINSATESFQYRPSNISKNISNPTCSSPMGQNYSQNTTPVFHQSGIAPHQTNLQNVPMSSSGIIHIQNDLQQSQHLKPTTLLSEQVYAELKQMVCNKIIRKIHYLI